MKLNKDYWENKYHLNEIGWDIGTVSTPLKEYIDQIENQRVKNINSGSRKWI